MSNAMGHGGARPAELKGESSFVRTLRVNAPSRETNGLCPKGLAASGLSRQGAANKGETT